MPGIDDTQREFEQASETVQNPVLRLPGAASVRLPALEELTAVEAAALQAIPNLDERYRIESKIGEGGMGSVYKATHLLLNRPVAIKVLSHGSLDSPKAVMRFQQEAKAATLLSHEHIASVREFGVSKDGLPFLAMDYVSGVSLAQLVKEQPLAPTRAIEIFMQTCQAMSHAHKKGILHRDLKPANILLSEDGNDRDFVKLVDFGIAKIMPGTDQESVSLTQTGELFGTPLYMSPEQCQGMEVDQRTDIYAMGCTMYETLTGSPPFSAQNSAKLMYSHIFDLPKPFSNRKTNNGKQLRALENIVLRCLEKDARLRYQSMDDLLAALDLVKHGRQPAAGISQTARRRRKLIGFALLCALILPLMSFSYICYPIVKNFLFPPPQPVWMQTFTEAEMQIKINARVPAEALLRNALRQAEAGNANESDKFKIYYELGNVYLNDRQYTRALKAFNSALPLSRAMHMPMDTANTLELIAYTAYCTHFVGSHFISSPAALQDCRQGIELATEALTIKESKMGPEHVFLTYTLTKLATLHQAVGDYDKAESEWRRALEIDKKSPTTRVHEPNDLANLARTLKAAGKIKEARESYRQAIELSQEIYGSDSNFVQHLKKEIANCY